ncbi:MAG: PQQ-binding-like beta-propeller repeat protein, partial [Planctomycetaceae bacterium]|nr:PQQ-binding-like beta-propeller repeat protein [Planctomycetaceae bacterium]
MSRKRCRPAIGGFGLTVCLWAGLSAAQDSRLPLPADEHRAVLGAATASLQAGNFADAADRWQSVLDMPEDYFDPAAPEQSLRLRAEESLLQSSAECREVYEVRYGPGARALLGDALRDADDDRLKEVVRRYFVTVSGHAAGAILAQRLADDGDALTAARVYDRLARHPLTTPGQQQEWLLRSGLCWRLAGFEAVASERLDARNRSVANQPPAENANPAFPSELQTRLAQQVAATGPGPTVALSETAMSRGNAQRNGQYVPAVPVGPLAWEYPVVDGADSPFDEARSELMLTRMRGLRDRKAGENPQRMLLTAGTPVTADGLVVVRGPGTIKAISLQTGALVWPSVYIDDTFFQLVTREWSRRDEDWHGPNLDLLLSQRMWRDSTAAALSTDGRFVYAIADGGMVSSIVQSAVTLPALSDHPLAPHSSNRLLAFELRTGRLCWELGGPRATVPLSGAFFLGAPLPLDGHLYCLVEDQGQVQLVVLESTADEARIIWSQALYNPMANLSNPAVGTARRMAGLTPSAMGDVVICPTGETTVVAVDRQRRALLWSYEYQPAVSESPQHQLMIRMVMQRQNLRGRIEDQLADELLKADHWQDSAVVIAGEYALLTMPDSQDLICLRLLEGTEVWRRPRGLRQFIAAVHDQRVVLVGQEQVDALRLESGEPAWTASLPIPGPGGRGFQHDRYYVLPLTTGEAATIDLVTGRETARTRLPDECARGNLTATDGRIVCQTAIGVQALQSLSHLSAETDAQLAANGDDAAALLRRGQIRLHLGQETEALADLRRAVGVDPQSAARGLLAATLIEGLRTDFDTYRSAAPEIEALATDAADQAQFHRLFAAGLQRRGEVEAAFQQYLKFADNSAGFSGLQKVDGTRQVRGDL